MCTHAHDVPGRPGRHYSDFDEIIASIRTKHVGEWLARGRAG